LANSDSSAPYDRIVAPQALDREERLEPRDELVERRDVTGDSVLGDELRLPEL